MNTRVLQVGLGLLVLIGVATGITVLFQKADTFRGTLYDPALPAPEIVLTQGNGSSFQLSEMRGRVVLLFFGYTSCPDVCPTTLSDLHRVMQDLGPDAEQVQVLFVTVDPERDTPQNLQNYVSIFDPTFIGLTGSMDEMEKVWSDYGVYREKVPLPNSETGYVMNHSARLYVIDRDGKLHLSYSFGSPTEDIVHDLKILFE